jgi:hypothetical protein
VCYRTPPQKKSEPKQSIHQIQDESRTADCGALLGVYFGQHQPLHVMHRRGASVQAQRCSDLDIQKVEDIVTQVVRREIRLSILQFAVGFLAGKLTTCYIDWWFQKELLRDIDQSFQKKAPVY